MTALLIAACYAQPMAAAGGGPAREYTIYYSGLWGGEITITQNTRGTITIIPRLTDMGGGNIFGGVDITHAQCPLVPERKSGTGIDTGFTVFTRTQNIVIDGNTTTQTDKNGAWKKWVVEGNTTTNTTNSGFLTTIVVEGNTITTTMSDGWGQRSIIDGNTITYSNSREEGAIVVNGNTRTAIMNSKVTALSVVEGNTTLDYFYRGGFQARMTTIDTQGSDIYIEIHSDSSLRNNGYEHIQKGDYDRAIEDYEAALRLDPNNPDTRNSLCAAYIQRGNAYIKQEDRNRARVDWSRALELDPKNPTAQDNLANF
jgi:hypothetical protein